MCAQFIITDPIPTTHTNFSHAAAHVSEANRFVRPPPPPDTSRIGRCGLGASRAAHPPRSGVGRNSASAGASLRAATDAAAAQTWKALILAASCFLYCEMEPSNFRIVLPSHTQISLATCAMRAPWGSTAARGAQAGDGDGQVQACQRPANHRRSSSVVRGTALKLPAEAAVPPSVGCLR
jgi:hypothetical protein